ncbi:MAG: leucyl/phenylalanyl-tRNA--protein transferase [Spirochaetaceae bacterium]|nr:MAG: leucyl/phenylalanyl-tRNA--protein transferase [Spirochaetaceae bacterium]
MKNSPMNGLPYIIDSHSEPVFPDSLQPDENGLIAVGGELTERVLVEAYSKGIFPWFNGPPIMWFSTEPRPVLFPDRLRISKRLERTLKQGRFDVQFDRDFEKVVFLCGTVPRRSQEGSWIDRSFFEAYTRLHYRRYITHCVSVYREGRLCGGLYGLTLGRVFFGESMFSLEANASKVALVHLCRWLKRHDFLMIDCQQVTPHILSLGAVELSRSEYLELVNEGLRAPHHHYPWRED